VSATLSDYEHRASGVMDAVFADRAQQHAGERPLPTATDDKEVSVTSGIE
jgi:hypothetical protein